MKTVRLLADAGAIEVLLLDRPGGMSPDALAHPVAQTKGVAPAVAVGALAQHLGMAVAMAVSACTTSAVWTP